MTPGLRTVVYPVTDVAAAKSLYAQMLGLEPYVDEPYYVGFNLGDLEVGLDPNGHAGGSTAPVCYWEVEDIASSFQSLLDAGAESHGAINDVGGGKLVATVRDGDGNITGLVQSP